MALSASTIRKLRGTLGRQKGQDVADQISSGGNPVAANVAVLGETSDLTESAASATVATGGTPDCDASQVEAGIEAAVDAAVDALAAEVEARLDAIEAKVDAVITALTASGQMAS